MGSRNLEKYSINEEKTSLQALQKWQFREVRESDWFPARVPGCIHTDLLQNHVIPDPFYRENEKKLQWIEQKDWEYKAEFFISASDFKRKQIDLLFEGLDTFADVYWNGHLVLQANNMFRKWYIPGKSFVQPGKNEIRILFHSPIRQVIPGLKNLPYVLPSAHDQQSNTSPYIRKAPYQFGWDWGPRFVTMGIWKPAFLNIWSTAQISNIWVQQKYVSQEKAQVTIHVQIQAESIETCELRLHSRQGYFAPISEEISLRPGTHIYVLNLEIRNPNLWWPNGMGEPFLYELEVLLLKDNHLLSQANQRVGLRTLELRQEPDQWGKSFEFVVNGVPVFAKGGNWIPADSFPSRVTEAQYRHLLQSVRDIHMNMVRVWGGGIYENDVFYDICDEFGLLVWQDFMFACSLYPGDSEFLENVKREAIDQIKRLRNHPSLALWCGNNEIEASWSEWGWKENLPDEVWNNYQKLFHELLPNVCHRFDPERPYWPSSPSSNLEDPPSSPSRGDVHFWDVWHKEKPFEAYQGIRPRFVSEYGFQSFPELRTIQSFSLPKDRQTDTPVMLSHQKDYDGNQKIYKYLRYYYNPPKDFPSFLYLSQVLQAQGIKFGTEHFRRLQPRCSGTLYWQINDCWPVASWSSIDYFGRWKALHYYARRFFSPVLVSPTINQDDQIQVYIISNKMENLNRAKLSIELFSTQGKCVQKIEKHIKIPPISNDIYFEISKKDLLENRDPSELFLFVHLKYKDMEIAKNTFFFVAPKELQLHKATIDVKVFPDPEGFLLRLISDYFAKDVFVSIDNKDGFFSENYFDLIPRRPVEFYFKTYQKMSVEAFRSRLHIMSLRDSFS